MTRTIDIQGHRGARALFPENTLEGFQAAAALGVKAFELDVGMTADRVVVVHHDPLLNPDIARNRTGAWIRRSSLPIWSMRYPALMKFDVGRLRPGSPTKLRFPDQRPHDGARIPTLAAVLAALPDARFTIEVKTHPAYPSWTASPELLADGTMEAIDRARALRRVTVEAFDWRVQRHIRKLWPEVRLAWLTRPETVAKSKLWWNGIPTPASVPAAVALEGGPVWAPDYESLTEPQVAEAKALGLSVWPWTVNNETDMSRLIGWGVDGLISDRPDLGMALVRGIGGKVGMD